MNHWLLETLKKIKSDKSLPSNRLFGTTSLANIYKNDTPGQVKEDLRKWFKDKWVRMDTKGNIKGDCAREEGEGKPKCLPLAKARAMKKKDRAAAAKRKRREDPVADREGKGNKPVNVATVTEQTIQSLNWKNKEPAKYAIHLSKFFGEPDFKTEEELIWEAKDGFKRIVVKDEYILHGSPAPHYDFIYCYIDLIVPSKYATALAESSGSILIDFLKGEVGARCGSITANATTLNYVLDVVAGRVKPTKEEYEKRILNMSNMFNKGKKFEIDWWPDTTKDSDPSNSYYKESTNQHHKHCGCAILKEKVSSSELIKKSQEKRGAPGTLKAKIKGPITMAKVRALKNKSDATTLDKKQANFYINMHSEEVEELNEKNKPTNPKLWSQAVSLAKSKFDVYPSAYANGWAARWYKSKGGSWKSVSEETLSQGPCWDGYKMAGYKTKNNKKVPNCVPEERMSFKEFSEATYQGKKVPLNKPMAGDVKKSKVFVDPDGDGVAKKVNFGDPNMTIKKNIPARRKSFRARHNCDNPGPKDKPRFWSCKMW